MGWVALGLWAAVGQVSAQTAVVPTVAVQMQSASGGFSLDGVIQPVKQSTVAAQASGRIATLLVKAGDKVKAGQLLATIDDREALAGLQRSQAQVNQADAEARNAQAQLERTRDLQTKGFVSKAALDTADTQYKSALAMRDQATASARQSSISQGFTRVSAPFDGWVLQTFAEAGDLAVPGKPLLTVYAPQPLRAVVQVPASRAQSVGSAPQTRVLVDAPAGGAGQTITPVSRTSVPSADPVSQTMEWRLELPAKEAAQLVPGQQVRVNFSQLAGDSGSRLVVPAEAVVRRGELTAVYVVSGNGFALRAVRLGRNQGADGVEVFSGLVAGELVALDPNRAGFANATAAKAGK
jgi:RND family efflux transporter MFP subunit